MARKGSKQDKIKANPRQRYYVLEDQEGKPVSYESATGKKLKSKHASVSADRSKISHAYPRAPSFSPISRLRFGEKLEKLIQKSINEKIASGSAGPVMSVGNISSLETLKPLTEEELLRKFGTKNITSNFERPYDDIDYTTFHDSVRSDGMTRIVAIKKPQYVVGEFTDIEFVPSFLIQDDDERNKVQDNLNKNELLNSFRQELKKIDEDVDFYLALHGILMHQSVFGQSLVAVEQDKDDIPIALKILSGMRVGRLFKNKKDWKIRGVEYLDYSAVNQRNILPAENIIYIPNLDFNLAPNTSGYGLSDMETIRHIAEQNVILNQMDMKEAAAKYHTPKTFTSVKNADTPEDITDLAAALEVSQDVVTDLDAEAKVIDNTTNVIDLATERDMNDAAIARYYDVPSILAGFENSQIRAAASQVLYAWTQSSLLKARDMLRVYLQKQWYMRNLKAVIQRRLRRLGILVRQRGIDGKIEEVIDPIKAKAQRQAEDIELDDEGKPTIAKDGNFGVSENGIPIDENGAEIIPKIESFKNIRDFIPFLDHLEKLPFTIKMTFEHITIDGLLEKAATVIGLKNARIINNMYAWKLLKFKDLEANPPNELLDEAVMNAEIFDQNTPEGRARTSRMSVQAKGGLGDIANTNIEKFVTQRGKKPRPKLQAQQ